MGEEGQDEIVNIITQAEDHACPFVILGLSIHSNPPPTEVDVKKAYRRKSKFIHPDKNAHLVGAHRAFQLLSDAYQQALSWLDHHPTSRSDSGALSSSPSSSSSSSCVPQFQRNNKNPKNVRDENYPAYDFMCSSLLQKLDSGICNALKSGKEYLAKKICEKRARCRKAERAKMQALNVLKGQFKLSGCCGEKFCTCSSSEDSCQPSFKRVCTGPCVDPSSTDGCPPCGLPPASLCQTLPPSSSSKKQSSHTNTFSSSQSNEWCPFTSFKHSFSFSCPSQSLPASNSSSLSPCHKFPTQSLPSQKYTPFDPFGLLPCSAPSSSRNNHCSLPLSKPCSLLSFLSSSSYNSALSECSKRKMCAEMEGKKVNMVGEEEEGEEEESENGQEDDDVFFDVGEWRETDTGESDDEGDCMKD